jgi:transposase
MTEITMIGVDLAKTVFQLHGVDASHRPVLRRQLQRTQLLPFFAKISPCVVVMEACGSAHHWAREIGALGHEVRLVPPAYARPFAKRGKSDSIDAEAVCEAGSRPSMRFVPIKRLEAQALATLHRARSLLDKQRTMLVNALRAHLAEFGLVAGKGIRKVPDLARFVEDAPPSRLPDIARGVLRGLLHMVEQVNQQLGAMEKELRIFHRGNATSQQLTTAPGIGLITATALTGLTPDAVTFKNGRHPRLRGDKLRSLAGDHTAAGFHGRQNAFAGHLESQATVICAVFSCLAPPRCCARLRAKPRGWRSGRRPFLRGGRKKWSSSPWPTSWRGSHGPSWLKARPIAREPSRHRPEPRHELRQDSHSGSPRG